MARDKSTDIAVVEPTTWEEPAAEPSNGDGEGEPRSMEIPLVDPLNIPQEVIDRSSDEVKRLFRVIDSVNIATELDKSTLANIAKDCGDDYLLDYRSLTEWRTAMQKGMKLAKLFAKKKSWPWPGASNAIYPLISQTSIQFGSRTMPNLVQGDEIVKGKKYGKDKDGQKQARSGRIAEHVNYQLLEQMPEWLDDQDLAMTALPVTGSLFKKTFYDAMEGRNVSELIYPDDLVINYGVRNLDKARRISHRLNPFTQNDIYERVAAGYSGDDTDELFQFIEQHRYLDLDKDGYKEPYIVTFHPDSDTVVRIKARWKADGIVMNEQGGLVKIIPRQYFTGYQFLRSFDGSVYGMGFGILLGQPNDTINAMVRQILDAETMHITGAGLISGDLGLQGQQSFAPNEYKVVNDVEDIGKKIYRLQTAEPSMATFRVLETLIKAFDRLGSQADVLSGEAKGANQPAASTLALIEQGLKVYNAILKRVLRAQRSEIKKMMRLNLENLDDLEYYNVVDDERAIARQDYWDKDADVTLIGAGEDTTRTEKLLKAQVLKEHFEFMEPPIRQIALKRIYEAIGIEDFEELFLPEDYKPEPSPEMKIKMFELDIKKMDVQMKEMELDIQKQAASLEVRRLKLDERIFEAEESHRQIESGIKLDQAGRERAAEAREDRESKVGSKTKWKVGA